MAASQKQNDTILLTNGRFFASSQSLSSPPAFHTAIVIRNNTIQCIGQAESPDIVAYTSSGIKAHDLQGRHVLPGFIDGHCHFLMLGQSLHKLDLDGCNKIDDIRSRIAQFAKENPAKERLLCRGWMHSMTDGEAKASMLDDLDPRPIFIDSKDLHSTWCNSAALQEMDVQNMKDPAGGTIERDSDGNPSGLLSEASVLTIVWPHLARVATTKEKTDALKAGIAAYHEAGYTGCIDMAMDENAWEAILALRDSEDGLLIRLAAHWLITPSADEASRLAQVDRAIELQRKFNTQTSPDLRIVGIKVICDGVIDACTAALTEPYSNNHTSTDPIWNADMLGPVVTKASSSGLQCALHAIGDAAVHLAINALEAYTKPGQRHRIEHLELTSPTDAARLGKLGIIASIQPVHADPAILRAWPKLLGLERVQRAFAYSEFAEHGAVLAIGSDSPTAPHAPIKNLYVATTRKSARNPDAGDMLVNENFKIGICEAVTAATKGSAYSCFSEDKVGILEVGKLADFVVVDMDFQAGGLLEAKVMQTWFDGKVVFDSSTA
ncbi:amidohydrolase family protein [Clohesyomyces aquaticus]|uniref:Amidohydrolase family protein n=1 Tax=Clohesyomyces aquaticus TaxID=1231657 RepID=A0A1Y1YUM4_9PLEO|nr:amidohydrolase family protein [Clohesyomyces aquaticus]